ncbi:DUF2169 domain-containing protein [Rhizobium calliandrae]|uniref:DUF2169 domain-containing protein n=1 Tax=Rhizobium calliandrae TaxID=1312182 RepID=A0ABT7KJR6_9HYPH|nr:DUF2169 domain-containing protein [Rhizobium calliandrae]MDL2408871.1 DUF2169 domain-containing protein [Rhizobium calliandrae]
MPALIKPSRLAAALRAEPVPQGGLLTVSVFILFDFENPRQILSEQALWPMVTDQMPPGAIFDKGSLKPCGEVIVAGAALAPSGIPVTGLQVVVRLGSIEKTLNVFGDRFWRRTDRGVELTPAIPFDRMPMDEAHAFGGPRFAENPRGKGHDAHAILEAGYDAPLPNLENPQHLIRSPDDQVRPAHLGPLPPEAPHRTRYAGTYDQRWVKNRAPMKPDDFNPLFHCDAPDDQRLETFFSGDERFSVSGMSRGAAIVGGALPNMAPRAFVHRPSDDSLTETPMVCDTVTLFPNITKAVMTFRGLAKACDPFCEDIGSVMLACEHREDQPRPAEYYVRIFKLRTDPEQTARHVLSDFQLMPLRNEAKIRARRAARIERAKQGQQTFVDNQNWLIRKAMADQGVLPSLAPLTIDELDEMPLVPLPDREEIERGEVDIAELLDDVEALSQAIAAKNDLHTAKAELSRQAAVKAIPPSFLPEHVLKPLASEKDLARYPGLTPFDGASEELRVDLSAMRPTRSGDDLFADLVNPVDKQIDEVFAAIDTPKAMEPGFIEAQYNKACARAMKLPEALLFHEIRLEIESVGAPSMGDNLKVGPDEPKFIAEVVQRMNEISKRPIEDVAPSPTLTPAFSSMAGPDGDTSKTAAAIAEGMQSASAHLSSLLPGVAASRSASLDDMLATLIASLPASPSTAPGQTLSEVTAQKLTDASENIAAAEAKMTQTILEARQKTPAAIFPLEPLAAPVAQRLGAFVMEKLAQGHDFSGADLAGATMIGADLTGRSFRSTFFERCDLSGTSFADADLEGAVFTETNLENANFTGARVGGINLSKANLRGARFDGCRIANTTLVGVDMRGASFRHTTLSEVVLIDCQLDDADFAGTLLADFQVLRGQADGIVMAEAEVARGVFIEVSMKQGVFRGASFERTTFGDVIAPNADFSRVHLKGSSFIGACDLTGGMFAEAAAISSSWNGSRLGRSCFLRATLNRSLFNGCEMPECDLRLASLREARLDRSALAGSDLFGANLYAASLAGCDLTCVSLRGANLYFADLDGAKLGHCDLTGANLGKTTMERATDV